MRDIHGAAHFDYMPESYNLPDDFDALQVRARSFIMIVWTVYVGS